jgi:hypothetical protein
MIRWINTLILQWVGLRLSTVTTFPGGELIALSLIGPILPLADPAKANYWHIRLCSKVRNATA